MSDAPEEDLEATTFGSDMIGIDPGELHDFSYDGVDWLAERVADHVVDGMVPVELVREIVEEVASQIYSQITE